MKTMNMSCNPRSKLFYGWVVVLAAFAITFVGLGSFYTFGSFLESLQKEFGASRGPVSLVFSFAGFLYLAFGVVSGPLSDKWGVKKLAMIGMGLVGLGLILGGIAQTLTHVFLAYGVCLGVGVGCAFVPTLAAVQRWFVKRRGIATGIAVSGVGVGTLVMPPIATWLIAHFGWRNAYFALGIFAILLGISAAYLMEDDPASRGLHPDDLNPEQLQPSNRREGLSVRQALRTRSFRGTYAACLVGTMGIFVPFVHLMPYASDLGIATSVGVWLLAAIGIGSTIGRFFFGGLADRFGRVQSLIGMHLGIAAALTVWAVSGTLVQLVLFSLIFGMFYGGWIAILPAVVADLFGSKHVGAIIGVLYTSGAVGTLLGPSAAGFLYDLSHAYILPIAISAVLNVIAAVILFAVVNRLPEKKNTD